MKSLFWAVIFASWIAFAQESTPVKASIRHVTVVNVETGAELQDQTVKIEGSRIVSIAATQTADATLEGGIDAHGGYLIPGLWDMHVHVHDTDELPLYIANGVTGIRIMSGAKNTAQMRAWLAAKDPSPEIILASAIVDGSSPVWPGSIVLKKPADAERTVREIKESGADFIKVYDGIPRNAYLALASQAKLQNIAFAGHVPDAVSAQEASATGQRSMEHLQGVSIACSRAQQMLMSAIGRARFFRDRLAIEDDGFRDVDEGKCHALFAEFRQNNTWQVPTLTVLRLWGRLDDSHFVSDPRLEYIGKPSRARWDDRTEFQRWHWTPRQFDLARNLFSNEQRLVRAMFREGVPMMAGTDAMNPYCFPGFSLHDELALLVDSGLTPLAALQAATINPAIFLGKTADWGTVQTGKIASLVLLRADPLTDIHNTTKIEAVWLRGRYIDAPALARMLQTAKEAAMH